MSDKRIQRQRRPTVPGEILREEYLAPRHLSVSGFARHVGLSRKHVSDIVNGRARVRPPTAVMFARAFGTTPALWLTLQNAVDLWDAEQSYRNDPTAVALLPQPLPPSDGAC